MVDKGKALKSTPEQRKLLSTVREKFVEIAKEVILLKKIIFGSQEEEIMNDEIKIPVFDRKDYSTWKKRILTFLKMKKCEETCKRVRQQNENADDWNQKNLKAKRTENRATSVVRKDIYNTNATAKDQTNQREAALVAHGTSTMTGSLTTHKGAEVRSIKGARRPWHRYNRSVLDTARCLLAEAKLQKKYWPEVIKAAVYLKNRTLANTVKNKTPYEIMMGEKPDIRNLRLYGSKIFVRVPKNKKLDKWEKKAELGRLIGYEKVGYRVLINNKVVISRHVDIVEEDVETVGLKDDNDNCEEKKEYRNDSENENSNEREIVNENLDKQNEIRRSQRNRKQPNWYTDSNHAYCIYVNYMSADSPLDYNEAIKDENSKD
ncbi:uncharacterized protein LOC114944774 [Nylanderia fulva]|uniref:uncharacterized protein LOC114944774 n=1 Tax=Nylanderia fulva TaxID=613905 RepID=UPI0010FB4C88|nr:uncharacterized protein LOC114944774 [Nylanderia fulva]